MADLRDELNARLQKLNGQEECPWGFFMPAADLMLHPDFVEAGTEAAKYFAEYFTFGTQTTPIDGQPMGYANLSNPFKCLNYPPDWPIAKSCLRLDGKRGMLEKPESKPRLQRLFVADLVWLFYFERMGIRKIVGRLLDDFFREGKYPQKSNGLVAAIEESMGLLIRSDLFVNVRDIDATYRQALGWTSGVGRKLENKARINKAFDSQFHRLIYVVLQYLREKRLAEEIRTGATGSVESLTTIAQTIDVLKMALAPFGYGRNYTNTLNGIVWSIAGLGLVQKLRTSIGIPDGFKVPHQYMQAAYDILVSGGEISESQTNRYALHRDCAESARSILLDIEVVNYEDANPNGELDKWVAMAGKYFEKYRQAYLALTSADVGASGTPFVEQQA